MNNSSLNKPFSRITRSSAKNINENENTNESKATTATTESVEIKLPNTTVSSVNANDQNVILTTMTTHMPPSLSTTTFVTTSSSSSNTKPSLMPTATTKQHTVMKVEIPKFTKSNTNININEQQQQQTKPIDEIKKEELSQLTNTQACSIDPLISKLSSSSITTHTTKPSPSASPQVITTTATVTTSSSAANMNMNTIIQGIPNISERIHNSTTALKLKTGKFHLDDYQLSSNIITPSINTIGSSVHHDQTIPSNVHQQQQQQPPLAHSKIIESFKTATTITTTQQPCIPTSVVVTSSFNANNNNSNIISSNQSTSNLIINPIQQQQQLNPSISPNTTTSAQQQQLFNTSAIDLQMAAQMRLKGAKTPSQLNTTPSPSTLSSSPFVQMPPAAADFNLFHQQMLLQQMQQQQSNQTQFINNNPYLAALQQHPDLRGIPSLATAHNLAAAAQRFSPFGNLQPQQQIGSNEKEIEDKLKMNNNKNKSIKDQDSILLDSQMPPPSLLAGQIRLPTGSTIPSVISSNTPLLAGQQQYGPLIRPIPPHLLSPHDTNAVNQQQQQQRFTESPALAQYNRQLMSPNLKVDVKPQLLQPAHQNQVTGVMSNNNKTTQFEIQQRPQSTFSVPINSPNPVTLVGSVAAQLSPSLSFSNNNNEQQTAALHPRKLHHKTFVAMQQQQAAKEQQQQTTMLNNLMATPYQLQQAALLNNTLPYQQQFAMQQQQQQQQQTQMPTQIIQQSIVQQPIQEHQNQSGGDSVLIQKYPKVWQGLLSLKNDQAAVQMHFVTGNASIARNALPPMIGKFYYY